MNPLPDRTVIVGILATLGLVFALIFWTVRLSPSTEPPMLWKEQPNLKAPQKAPSGMSQPGSLI
jgi:hypothetical protein